MIKIFIVMSGLVVAAPAVALAANANQPYANIDHRVDAGNNTGDAQVDQLNQAQLSQPGQAQPYAGGLPSRGAAAAPGYGGTYPPPSYATPVYAPPPYPYAYYPPPPYVVVPRRFVRPFYYPYY